MPDTSPNDVGSKCPEGMDFKTALQHFRCYFYDVPDPDAPKRWNPKTETEEPWPPAEYETFRYEAAGEGEAAEEMKHQLYRALSNGDAICEAERVPVAEEVERRRIPSERWGSLKIDFDKNEAHGGGLRYISLRFWTKGDWILLKAPKKSVVGGKTQRLKIMALYQDREEAGETEKTLESEAKKMSDILKKRHTDIKRGFSRKTIERVIRNSFNTLKNKKNSS